MAARRSDVSEAVENYAKAIYAIQDRDGTVTTNALAERLGVTPASASGMVKKLDGLGLVSHVPYKGVQLTEEGRRAALRTIRRHRLIEAYLVAFLGYTWDTVHDEAERLEHAVSDQLVERMASVLGHPSVDPHGDPIPDVDGAIHEPASTPLSELPEGILVELRRVDESDPERLRYIASIGLRPGARVIVVDRQPFHGPITIEVEGQSHVIGHELGHVLRCVPLGEDA